MHISVSWIHLWSVHPVRVQIFSLTYFVDANELFYFIIIQIFFRNCEGILRIHRISKLRNIMHVERIQRNHFFFIDSFSMAIFFSNCDKCFQSAFFLVKLHFFSEMSLNSSDLTFHTNQPMTNLYCYYFNKLIFQQTFHIRIKVELYFVLILSGSFLHIIIIINKSK